MTSINSSHPVEPTPSDHSLHSTPPELSGEAKAGIAKFIVALQCKSNPLYQSAPEQANINNQIQAALGLISDGGCPQNIAQIIDGVLDNPSSLPDFMQLMPEIGMGTYLQDNFVLTYDDAIINPIQTEIEAQVQSAMGTIQNAVKSNAPIQSGIQAISDALNAYFPGGHDLFQGITSAFKALCPNQTVPSGVTEFSERGPRARNLQQYLSVFTEQTVALHLSGDGKNGHAIDPQAAFGNNTIDTLNAITKAISTFADITPQTSVMGAFIPLENSQTSTIGSMVFSLQNSLMKIATLLTDAYHASSQSELLAALTGIQNLLPDLENKSAGLMQYFALFGYSGCQAMGKNAPNFEQTVFQMTAFYGTSVAPIQAQLTTEIDEVEGPKFQNLQPSQIPFEFDEIDGLYYFIDKQNNLRLPDPAAKPPYQGGGPLPSTDPNYEAPYYGNPTIDPLGLATGAGLRAWGHQFPSDPFPTYTPPS